MTFKINRDASDWFGKIQKKMGRLKKNVLNVMQINIFKVFINMLKITNIFID